MVVSAPENGGFMPQHAPEFHFSLPPTVFSLRKSRKQGMVLILVVKPKFWDRVEQKKYSFNFTFWKSSSTTIRNYNTN